MPQLDSAVFLPQLLWFLSLYYIFSFLYVKIVLPRVVKQYKMLRIATSYKKRLILKRKNQKLSYLKTKKTKVLENIIKLSLLRLELVKKQSLFLQKILKK